MKPFRFIIAIFGLLLLLVAYNAQGNPSMRVSQETSFVPDHSPPSAQLMAVQPGFGQSLQVERGVSVPILFSSVDKPGHAGCNYKIYRECFKRADSAFKVQYSEYQYLRCPSDLGDRYDASQTYLHTQYLSQIVCKRFNHLQPASHYRAREKL